MLKLSLVLVALTLLHGVISSPLPSYQTPNTEANEQLLRNLAGRGYTSSIVPRDVIGGDNINLDTRSELLPNILENLAHPLGGEKGVVGASELLDSLGLRDDRNGLLPDDSYIPTGNPDASDDSDASNDSSTPNPDTPNPDTPNDSDTPKDSDTLDDTTPNDTNTLNASNASNNVNVDSRPKPGLIGFHAHTGVASYADHRLSTELRGLFERAQ